MTTAKVLLDSITKNSNRLITLELEYPKNIHWELLTHRDFSRNASSTRAIPVNKMIEETISNPAKPTFMENIPGMQADTPIEGDKLKAAEFVWAKAQESAILAAQTLSAIGVHKQVTNRLLYPFSNIKVVLSSTQFSNFFKLRRSPDAQQEMQELADAMHRAISQSKPKLIFDNSWHMPYLTVEDRLRPIEEQLSISAARCARVSYNKNDVLSDPEADLELARKLASAGHMSPFEHIATPAKISTLSNFKGWNQLRHFIESETIKL